MEEPVAKHGGRDTANSRRHHVRDRRGHLDRHQARDAHEEAEDTLAHVPSATTALGDPFGGTHRDDGTHHEGREGAHLARCTFIGAEQELHDAREFADEHEDRGKDNRAEEVRVPGQVQCAPVHNVQALLDDDRVEGGDHGTENAEGDANHGHLGAVEEDADKESDGDNCARSKDTEGGARMQEEEGRADSEWKDHAARDLIERRVDVFQGIIAEATLSEL